MRNHVHALLQIVDTSLLPIDFPPLTVKEAESYVGGTQQGTPGRLRVDFEKQWKRFRFNKDARQIMITTFLGKVEGSAFLTNPTPAHLLTLECIGDAINVYMKRLRRLYQDSLNPPTKEKQDAIKRRACQVSHMHTVSSTSSSPSLRILLTFRPASPIVTGCLSFSTTRRSATRYYLNAYPRPT